MRGDQEIGSPDSRRIRRVVSCDDGGLQGNPGNLSPIQLRQIMSFEHTEQRLLLSPAEDTGDPGVEVNLVEVPVQQRENPKYPTSAPLEDTEEKPKMAKESISLPSLDEMQSSESQSSSAHKMRKKILISGGLHSSCAKEIKSERDEDVVEKGEHSIPGNARNGIGVVLSASKSSGDAAEAALKLADSILSRQKMTTSEEPAEHRETRGSKNSEDDFSLSSELVAVDSVEDQIISEARNAAAQMISSEQVIKLVEKTGKKEMQERHEIFGEASRSSSLVGKSSPEMLESSSADQSTVKLKGDVLKNKSIDQSASQSVGPDRASANSSKTCTTPGKDTKGTVPSNALGSNVPITSKGDSLSLGSQQSAEGGGRPQTPPMTSSSCANQTDNALELSPEGGTDVSDDAYSKLPGRLSYSPHIHERKAILNTLDGFNKSPARRKLPSLLVDSPSGPLLPSTLQSGEGHKSPERLMLQRRDTPSSHTRSTSEPTSKIHDLLSDVKTNLAKSQMLRSDGRMHEWIRHSSKGPSEEGIGAAEDEYAMYTSGKSRTLIVHEIRRGDWTWCSAWSPDGGRLAIATVNHHLAVVDTASSSIWKVVHDQRLSGSPLKGTTHSIRSIAWGSRYIAIGGVGDSVSIVSPNGQYPVVHIINGTGFVGSLSWRAESSILAIGSRNDRCLIVDVKTTVEDRVCVDGRQRRMTVSSKLLHTIRRRDWVNAVAFNSDGKNIAMGDRSGLLSVEMYLAFARSTSSCKEFQFSAAILDISWSTDGHWLYSSGEDFAVTVIDTSSWSIAKRIRRDRWCDCVASSHGGRHVAVGGGKNGLDILGVDSEWDRLKELKYDDIVPLSASWHPQDHYLTMTGQSGTIAAIETSDIPYMAGKYMHSKCSIASVDFSPDGKLMAVANVNGLVSFFDTTKSELEIVYELIGCGNSTNCVRFSPNGKIVAISGGGSIMVLNAMSTSERSRAIKSASMLCLRQTMKGFKGVESISFSPDGEMIAANGPTTAIYTAVPKFRRSRQLKKDHILVSSWSPDGTLFAMVGRGDYLTIYDTVVGGSAQEEWSVKFNLLSDGAGLALAWGPSVGMLQYLACGGEGKKVTILEIRTREMTWETVLVVPRPAKVTALDWHASGVLAVGCGDGSATVIDLGYLQSGRAVNEMDYNWQKQALLSFTEILRKENGNCITALRWMGTKKPGDCSKALALGGTDGVVEVLDLTERSRLKARNCK